MNVPAFIYGVRGKFLKYTLKLLEKFNIVPNNEDLYEIAFTHSSYSAKYDLDYDYERLEFLGDSVLGLLCRIFLTT